MDILSAAQAQNTINDAASKLDPGASSTDPPLVKSESEIPAVPLVSDSLVIPEAEAVVATQASPASPARPGTQGTQAGPGSPVTPVRPVTQEAQAGPAQPNPPARLDSAKRAGEAGADPPLAESPVLPVPPPPEPMVKPPAAEKSKKHINVAPIITALIFLFITLPLAALFVVQQRSVADIRGKAAACVSCAAGVCPNGTSYHANACISQASCAQYTLQVCNPTSKKP